MVALRDQTQIEQLLEKWKEFLETRFGAIEGESFLEILLKLGPDESLKRRPELARLMSDPRFQALSLLRVEQLATISDEEYIELFEPIAEHYGFAIIISDHVVIMRELLKHLGNPSTILDVGCGPCSYLIFLQCEEALKTQATGLDPSPGILAQAKRISAQEGVKVNLTQGWAKALPFCDSTFEQIISIDTIHWTEVWQKALSEMARVTKSRGEIFISYTLFSPRRRIPVPKAVEILSNNGIDIQGVTKFVAEKSASPRVFIVGIKQEKPLSIIVPTTTDYSK